MECLEESKNKETNNITTSSNLDILKSYNNESFRFINEGLNLEDRNKTKEAILCYKKGIRSCDAAIQLPSLLNEELSTDEQNEYEKLLSKLKRAKEEVSTRLIEIDKSEDDFTSMQPSHQDDKAAQTNNGQIEVAAIKQNNQLPKEESNEQSSAWQDVKQLVDIKEGVNLFHVDKDGEVSTWEQPCKLEVFQILKKKLEEAAPAAFLKCGEWVYPMEPGKSPVLKTKRRTYMFPDLSKEQQPEDSQLACIGVVLADIVPDNLVSRFERVLSCYCDYRHEPKPLRPPLPSTAARKSVESTPSPPPTERSSPCATPIERTPSSAPPRERAVAPSAFTEEITATPAVASEVGGESAQNTDWTERISSGIHVGSKWVSWGFVKGAQVASNLVSKGAVSLRERIEPNEQPTRVDADLQHNIRQLQQTTGSIVQVSSFLVNALASMTVNIARNIAPRLQHHGQKLLPEKYHVENNESSQKKLDNVKKVATAGLQGFGLMFLALEQAGKNLYQSISIATVETVQHKYGSEVGYVTQDAMGAAGNTMQAYWNVKKLGAKAIAKRTAKETGKAMLTEDQNKRPPLT